MFKLTSVGEFLDDYCGLNLRPGLLGGLLLGLLTGLLFGLLPGLLL